MYLAGNRVRGDGEMEGIGRDRRRVLLRKRFCGQDSLSLEGFPSLNFKQYSSDFSSLKK